MSVSGPNIAGEETQKGVRGETLAAVSLGLLVGVFTGMSASPTVASVVGAASGVGLGWMTFWQGKGDKISRLDRIASAKRLTAFALSCLVAALGGLYVRTHGVFERSLQERVAELGQFQIRPAEAVRILFASESSSGHDPNAGVFYGLEATGGLPVALDPGFAETGPDALQAWVDHGGAWRRLAERLSGLPESSQLIAARALWRFMKEEGY